MAPLQENGQCVMVQVGPCITLPVVPDVHPETSTNRLRTPKGTAAKCVIPISVSFAAKDGYKNMIRISN